MIQRIVIISASLIALSAAASAADKDVPVWSGLYVGVNGGYGWLNDTGNITSTFPGFLNVNVTRGFKTQGDFGGGQIGYNWQGKYFGPHFLLGIEADIQSAAIRESFSQGPSAGSGLFFDDVFRSSNSLDWFGTVRGRLGYTFDRTLVYATGGFAYGALNQQITAVNDVPAVFEDAGNRARRTGFVVGGGFEYLVAPAWSLKAEYQYIDLGRDRLTGTNPLFHTPVLTNEISNNFHTARIGLNYHIAPRSAAN